MRRAHYFIRMWETNHQIRDWVIGYTLYKSECRCGWLSKPNASMRGAARAVAAHSGNVSVRAA